MSPWSLDPFPPDLKACEQKRPSYLVPIYSTQNGGTGRAKQQQTFLIKKKAGGISGVSWSIALLKSSWHSCYNHAGLIIQPTRTWAASSQSKGGGYLQSPRASSVQARLRNSRKLNFFRSLEGFEESEILQIWPMEAQRYFFLLGIVCLVVLLNLIQPRKYKFRCCKNQTFH